MPKAATGKSVVFNARALLWLLIAIYTYFLPDARIVYNAIVGSFGQEVAGKVPLVLVMLVGLAYTLALFRTRRSLKNLLFLIPAGLIAFVIMHFEQNPNKHAHIPEYVLMVWLLFTVLSRDYASKDIFVLIFICTTALGVVDELEQGIHPSRFYGLSDMIVNSASGLIGIFTVMGLKKTAAADWRWIAGLKEMRALAILALLGGAGVAAMVAHLFRVQSAGAFWGIYPSGLWAWTVLFLLLAPVMAWLTWRKLRNRQALEKTDLPAKLKIIQLWLFPLVSIFFYMNLLLFYVAISGTEFL